jgi:glycoprotein 2-beta-D-xylosyltransferase
MLLPTMASQRTLVAGSLPAFTQSLDKVAPRSQLHFPSTRTVNSKTVSSRAQSISRASASPRQSSVFDSAVFRRWKTMATTACGGRVQLFANAFAKLSRAVVDRHFCTAAARGGEDVEDVIDRDETDEFYNVSADCFQVECRGGDDEPLRSYEFTGVNYLNRWLSSLKTDDVKFSRSSADRYDSTFTIAITRHEYANVYHTLTDWYNTFIVMTFFGKVPRETNILFVDAHARGQLDDAWSKLYNRFYYLSELPTRTMFKQLVWGIQGYNSPIKDNHVPDLPPPLVEQFRSFFLSAFNVKGQKRSLNCSSISVLLLWRHDYVAHPRNPSGMIRRKIANEGQLLDGVRRSHPDFVVRGVQIDSLPLASQLQAIADTDVLIGMHGAGLAHVMFMPAHGALVELYPSYYTGYNYHFKELAKWRGINYITWRSNDTYSELQGYRTRIPVGKVNQLLDLAVSRICQQPV